MSPKAKASPRGRGIATGRSATPAARKPVAKKPVAKKPVAKKPVAKKPVATKPVATKAAVKVQAASRPAAPKPAAPKRAAPKRTPATAARARRAVPGAPRTLAEFMAQALVMENEAVDRYAELADAMEMHNNREVAALFRRMAEIEGKHAQQIMAEMGWTSAPPLPAGGAGWEGYEAPETAAVDDVHYLMQPYHALEVALAAEERAERFFARLVRAALSEPVRKAARELHEEEREHVRLVREWMRKVPKPDADWANDPDPPVYTD